APGFEIYDASSVPPKVKIRAPVSYLRSLSSVPTEKIDISGRQADFVARQVPVSVSNPKATVLESVVDAVFRIGESRIERT
ncbi:YbbR-like domain-containing protein, partial [Escherichia coli]|nr:YbbR-like domain-containing protein [Escherichia coli]